MDVVIPSAFFIRPEFAQHRKRATWQRFAIEVWRVMQEAGSPRCLRMRLETWAAAVGVSVARFLYHVEQLVADGCASWSEDGTFTWADWVWGEQRAQADATATTDQPRKRYPSDNNRLRHGLRNDSTMTPQTLRTDSATTPQDIPVPVTGNRPVPERNIYISNPEPVTGPVRSGEPDSATTPQPTPPNANERHACSPPTPNLTIAEPPLTVIERLVAEGMERHQATDRVEEFGADRWLEALEALSWRRKQTKPAPPAVGRGAGWMFDLVRNNRALPKAMIDARERAARGQNQTRLVLPVVVTQPVAAESEHAAHLRSAALPPDVADDADDMAEIAQFRRDQFWLALSPEEQAEIDCQIRAALPMMHTRRWEEGQPPPIVIRDAVEAKRREIIDLLMGQRRSA